jgi:uncharacterized membrane protein (DUF373 family)
MNLFHDIVNALKSKRVLLGVITAAIVGVNQELQLFADTDMTRIVAIVGALILGDSLRATNPDKPR